MSAADRDRPVAREAVAIEAAAVAWLCERDEGFTVERAMAFAAWCEKDPRHRAAVAKVERGLDLLRELPSAGAALAGRLGPELRRDPAPVRGHPAWARRWPVGLAAALLVVAGLWRWPFEGEAAESALVAGVTAPARSTLDDDTLVNLNTRSEVRVHYSPQERRVVLVRGEAHFEVKPDPARPFVVVADRVAVKAVGTMFAVRLGGAEVEVLVEEGRVAVASTAPPGPHVANPAVRPAPLVEAGERAVVARSRAEVAPQVEPVAPPVMGAALRWHRRVAVFHDTPLREVVTQFNRRNTRQIELADPELGDRRFGGALALDQVEALLRLLEREDGIAIERRAEHRVVVRRAQ